MKKIMNWLLFISFTVFLIDWGIIGVMLSQGDYDFQAGAWIGLGCFAVMFVCILYRTFSGKCPHCGKIRLTGGPFCPYCGKKID